MGDALCPLSTRNEHRHGGIRYVTPGAASCRTGWPHARRSQRGLPRRALTQPATLERADPQLETGRRRPPTLNPERDIIIRPATSQILLSGSIAEPAFPSRPAAAPKPRSATQERGGAEPPASHAQRALSRASMARMASTGPSPAVSTVAHSPPVGSPHLRTSTPQHNGILDRKNGRIITEFKRQLP